MKPVITEIIPQQNFEKIDELIGAILTVELANQKTLQNLPENHKVFLERVTSVDKSEEVVINVLFNSGTPASETEVDSQNSYNYFIDIWATGKTTDSQLGDENSALKLLKYVGLCRYILNSSKLRTLTLELGLIGGKSVQGVNMFEQQNNQDGNYSRMCRISFSVRALENEQAWEGVILGEHITEIKLEETELGYQYKLIN